MNGQHGYYKAKRVYGKGHGTTGEISQERIIY
nr:MAG TPA: hypothetical protein [Caudoviricetes sp.]